MLFASCHWSYEQLELVEFEFSAFCSGYKIMLLVSIAITPMSDGLEPGCMHARQHEGMATATVRAMARVHVRGDTRAW